jgi:hypothetical protein
MEKPPVRDRRSVGAAYDRFLVTGTPLPGLDPLVAASWRRSLRSGVDPDHLRLHRVMGQTELDEYRTAHPLAAVMPMLRELVVDGARDDGLVVAVTDDVGRLLWVEGSTRTRSTVERVGFVAGAVWREADVGTNAPGTALATRRPVQVLGAEHYSRPVQQLNCAAVPIRDTDGTVLGVLDVTGGRAAGDRITLALLRSTVAGLERELATRSRSRGTRPTPGQPALKLLGTPALRTSDGVRPVAGRHAEILALLAVRPRGLTADELAVLLHPGELSEVTVRVEISRLRRMLGPLVTGSRPYRLAPHVVSDVDVVRARLAAGDVGSALDAWEGPLLPRSLAPGVERLRAELTAEMRAAVLAAGAPDQLDAWSRTDDGADDLEAWRLLARRSAPGSPRWARARAHLAVVDDALR